jgi:DNA-directed RNA polymerase subunit RPC12/RpoP
MTQCNVCRQSLSQGELCGDCQRKLGLTSGGPVRRALPCARCNHPELIRALVREFASGGEYTSATVPMAVTYGTVVETSFWTGDVTGTRGVNEHRPFGVLEMYVCTRCGFTEWYCRNPSEIPIGPQFGTEKIDVRGDAPYR